MRNKSVASHVMKRDDVFYYVRHVPKDLIDRYSLPFKNLISVCFKKYIKGQGGMSHAWGLTCVGYILIAKTVF